MRQTFMRNFRFLLKSTYYRNNHTKKNEKVIKEIQKRLERQTLKSQTAIEQKRLIFAEIKIEIEREKSARH